MKQGQADRGKAAPRPKHVWSIRTKLQIEGRARDLAMFKLAINSKLRGCNLAHERPLRATSGRSPTTHQAKTARDMARVARGLGATISRMKSQNIVVWRKKIAW